MYIPPIKGDIKNPGKKTREIYLEETGEFFIL
jgi:hypothetical protein